MTLRIQFNGFPLLTALIASTFASTAAGQTYAWNDTFASLNTSLWIASTDIEHCSDGACFQARPDHLSFSPTSGLTVRMDESPCNTTGGCCNGSLCASWAAGHLITTSNYLYGTYSMIGKPAHAPLGGVPPNNSFACWTPLYTNATGVHNEITTCFQVADGTHQMHCSYWYANDAGHVIQKSISFDWTAASHNYTVVWTPTSLTWLADGVTVYTTSGVAGQSIPNVAGSMRVILRPLNKTYLGDSVFTISSMSYTSLPPSTTPLFSCTDTISQTLSVTPTASVSDSLTISITPYASQTFSGSPSTTETTSTSLLPSNTCTATVPSESITSQATLSPSVPPNLSLSMTAATSTSTSITQSLSSNRQQACPPLRLSLCLQHPYHPLLLLCRGQRSLLP